MNKELLKGIAKSDYKHNLITYLKEVQHEIADIRNGNYTNEARIAAVEAIEKHLIGELRVQSGEKKDNFDDYR
jgi:predicted transcriptional regulator